MLNADGNASNQVIWFTASVNRSRFDQTPEALEVMDEWMLRILANPEAGAAANRPLRATDRCFDHNGVEVANGTSVWDGIIDTNAPGACTQRFPPFSTSRRVAGGPFEQSIFKCKLITVPEAISRGFYGMWTPDAAAAFQLAQIFPQRVCDYSQPDQGVPPEW